MVCPYCGEQVSIAVDPGGGANQQYVEDCEVCCNPWQVSVRFIDGAADVQIAPLTADEPVLTVTPRAALA